MMLGVKFRVIYENENIPFSYQLDFKWTGVHNLRVLLGSFVRVLLYSIVHVLVGLSYHAFSS